MTMKKFKRLFVSLITITSLLVLMPVVAANAEWKEDSAGWWYANGSSWDTGWNYIDGNWYYFNSDGYMAHDCYIGDYYLNSKGAWTTSIPVKNSTLNNNSSSNQYLDSNGNGLIKGSKNKIYHVPGSKYYDKTKDVAQWFKTVDEAEAAGYRAPEK